MSGQTALRSTAGVKRRRSMALVAALTPALLLVADIAWAQSIDPGAPAVRLLNSIAVPVGPLNNTAGGMYSTDISFVDESVNAYFVADRSNRAIDVVSTKNETFIGQLRATPDFAGFTGSTSTSGPNGVVSFYPFLFATDANSRVVAINLINQKTVSDVSTGGAPGLRADELAGDPRDMVLLVVNNADSPPFATLIHVSSPSGTLTVGTRITFDKTHVGFAATNGAEQPVWEPFTGKFYLSIPEINGPGGGGPIGGVARIDPLTGNVETVYELAFCSPAGLTLGPNQNLLVGCNTTFDTAGNVWSGTDPNTAAPQQVIIDAKTGIVQAAVAGVGPGDEVWYNSGDNFYYTASSGSPLAPSSVVQGSPNVSQGAAVLGVIDAEDLSLAQLVPTINVPAVNLGAGNPKNHPAATAHTVAASAKTNHVFMALGANNVFPNCLTGCIAVYGRRPLPEDEKAQK